MKQIVEWRKEGFSFREITAHLDYNKVKSKSSGPLAYGQRSGWSIHRVHYGYYQELLIRWLQMKNANFRSPEVVHMLTKFGPCYRNKSFRRQLEIDVLEAELPNEDYAIEPAVARADADREFDAAL
jgi:hypothetical protein